MLTNCHPCTHNGTSCPVTLSPIEIWLFQITLQLLQISQNLIYIHLSSTVMVVVKPIPGHTWLQFFSPQMFMRCCRPHSAAKQESWRFACWSPRYGCCSRAFPLYNGWWQGDESKMTVQFNAIYYSCSNNLHAGIFKKHQIYIYFPIFWTHYPVTEFIHLILPYQKILVWTPWSLYFILIGFCYNSIYFIYILKILFWEVVHMLHQNAKEIHWHTKGEEILYERIKGRQVFRNKMLPGAKMSLCPREGVARTQQTCKKDAQFAQRMAVGPICHPLLTSKFLFPENTVPSYAFRNNGCRGNRSKRTPVGCG